MAKPPRTPSAVPQENTCQQRPAGLQYTVGSTCVSAARVASFRAVATHFAKPAQPAFLMVQHIKVTAHATQGQNAAAAALRVALVALAVIVNPVQRDDSPHVAWVCANSVLLDAFLLKRNLAGAISARQANLMTGLPTQRLAMMVRAAHLVVPDGIPVAARRTALVVLQDILIQEFRITLLRVVYAVVRALAASTSTKLGRRIAQAANLVLRLTFLCVLLCLAPRWTFVSAAQLANIREKPTIVSHVNSALQGATRRPATQASGARSVLRANIAMLVHPSAVPKGL